MLRDHLANPDEGETGRYELMVDDRYERRYRRELMQHPDCRDPDHPGCERCREDDEEETH